MRGRGKSDRGTVQKPAAIKKTRAGSPEKAEHPAFEEKGDRSSVASQGRSDQMKIRERAYFLFVSRGYEQGHELDHWLEAERQITRSQHAEPKQAPAKEND